MHKGELEVPGRKKKRDTYTHRLLLCRIHNKFKESSDSEQHPQENTKPREPGGTGRNQETGTGAQKECGETQSSNRTCCIVQLLSFVGF